MPKPSNKKVFWGSLINFEAFIRGGPMILSVSPNIAIFYMVCVIAHKKKALRETFTFFVCEKHISYIIMNWTRVFIETCFKIAKINMDTQHAYFLHFRYICTLITLQKHWFRHFCIYLLLLVIIFYEFSACPELQ